MERGNLVDDYCTRKAYHSNAREPAPWSSRVGVDEVGEGDHRNHPPRNTDTLTHSELVWVRARPSDGDANIGNCSQASEGRRATWRRRSMAPCGLWYHHAEFVPGPDRHESWGGLFV